MKKILLAGNPNVGKSTLFNRLTGDNQHTGNWIGKTVSTARGVFNYLDVDYEIYDLPGTYSLNAYSKEEEVARDAIYFMEYDLILVVVDSILLERNLGLLLQILEVNPNVILCCNLYDEANKKGVFIDSSKLSLKLGIDVALISARNNIGIDDLLDKIAYRVNNKNKKVFDIKYNSIVNDICNYLNDKLDIDDCNLKKFISLKILLEDRTFVNKLLDKYSLDIDDIDEFNNDIDNMLKLENTSRSKLKEMVSVDLSKIQSEIVSDSVTYKKKISTDKLDKLFVNKITGIPIMLLMLIVVFFITIVLSNYPSSLLFSIFSYIEGILYNIFNFLKIPDFITSCLVTGVYRTLSWVISVMLPPMAIFFPMFSLLEDLGYLPRVAFNVDYMFQKCGSCGKQSLTMMMGFGCNAVGVTGTRVIENKKTRLLAILTNSFVPCNGRFPMIISIITMFLTITSFPLISKVLILTLFIILSCIITFIATYILGKIILKSDNNSFILELPMIRKPEIVKTIIRSFKDKTLNVLKRAVIVSIPAGLLIWILSNIYINGISIINHFANFIDPFARLLGMDGVILSAFIFGFPANELVIPIMMMIYLSNGELMEYSSILELKNLFVSNGWTYITAISTIIFSMFHFPCSTTILTIYNELKSFKWTILAFLLPLAFGIVLCFLINIIF